MKTITDAIADQLKELDEAKRKNFGGIPDDYRQLNEEILAEMGPSVWMLMKQSKAASKFPDFIKSIESLGIAKTINLPSPDENTEVKAIGLTLDESKPDAAKVVNQLIRSNWTMFEPGFLMLYLGMKVGRQLEREEQDSIRSIARAERAKANPNSFDEIAPPKVMLAASTDSDTPALSPEKVETFRRELEEDLRRFNENKNKKED